MFGLHHIFQFWEQCSIRLTVSIQAAALWPSRALPCTISRCRGRCASGVGHRFHVRERRYRRFFGAWPPAVLDIGCEYFYIGYAAGNALRRYEVAALFLAKEDRIVIGIIPHGEAHPFGMQRLMINSEARPAASE